MAEHPEHNDFGEPDSLVIEERFAIVPEWLLDAEISDAAVRLYAVLLRYGQTSGARMPGRATLARRMRKKCTDTIDRAMKELVAMGAVSVEHRKDGRQRLTNRYHVRTHRPGRKFAATPSDAAGGSRTDAARGGRRNAAGVAAKLRPNPEQLTQSSSTQTPPPPSSSPEAEKSRARPEKHPRRQARSWREEHATFVAECGIDDWDGFVARVQQARHQAGQPTGRWAGQCLLTALQTAARARGWPAAEAPRALLAVASDPSTRSPMRVAEAGPWWDSPAPVTDSAPDERLAELEDALSEAGGLRITLQREARKQLSAEGLPLTRGTVLRRAHELLAARNREVAPC